MKIIHLHENNKLKSTVGMLDIDTNNVNIMLNNDNKKIKKESNVFVERYVDKYDSTTFNTTTQYDYDIKRNLKLERLGLPKETPTISPTITKRKKLKTVPKTSSLFNNHDDI